MGATISDVARQAGLSPATISKYLNHKPVSLKNREKIAEAIEQLDYQINDFARGLRTATSLMIGLLVPGIGNIFTISLIKEMEDMLIRQNYSMILCSYDNSPDKLMEKLSFMSKKKVDGIIFLSGGTVPEQVLELMRKLQQAGTSFVQVNGAVEGFEADAVLVDSVNSIYESVGLLIEHGHRNIGLLSAPKITSWNAREREEGYRRVFADYHLPVQERLLCLYGGSNNNSDAWLSDLSARGGEFLRRNPDMTALVLPGYRLTLAGLSAARAAGRTVGKDLSVIGFDCAEINGVLQPPLTYVALPAEKMAKYAVDLLIESLRRTMPGAPRIIRVKATLVAGESLVSV